MGSIKNSVLVFMVVLTAFCGVASGTLYTVGDFHGWTHRVNFDYNTWASSKQFHIGDFIRFIYDPRVDNVVRVTHKNFRSCNATNPINVMRTGEDIIEVRNPHTHFYFISSTPGHCEAGQKVDIRVYRPRPFSGGLISGAVPSPSPSSSPSVPSSGNQVVSSGAHRSMISSIVGSLLAFVFIYQLVVYNY